MRTLNDYAIQLPLLTISGANTTTGVAAMDDGELRELCFSLDVTTTTNPTVLSIKVETVTVGTVTIPVTTLLNIPKVIPVVVSATKALRVVKGNLITVTSDGGSGAVSIMSGTLVVRR